MKYSIVHDRPNCIGCGACAAVCPANWEMKDDGKSSAKSDSFDDKDLECNTNAAQSCPVNVIHIKKETGEQVI